MLPLLLLGSIAIVCEAQGDLPHPRISRYASQVSAVWNQAAAPGARSLTARSEVRFQGGDAVPGDTLRALYEGGRTFEDFLGTAIERRQLWDENYWAGEGPDSALVARARAVGGTWRFLAVTVDSCSDSANIIPYLARFVEMVEGVETRVVDPEAGRGIMEAHPTPDGRAATPTILLLNAEWNEVGCFIERPRPLQERILENPEELSSGEIYDFKMGWYAEDAGRATVRELVEMLEAAVEGRVMCGGGPPG